MQLVDAAVKDGTPREYLLKIIVSAADDALTCGIIRSIEGNQWAAKQLLEAAESQADIRKNGKGVDAA